MADASSADVDDNDQFYSEDAYYGRDGVIFLIDCDDKTPDSLSYIKDSFVMIEKMMMNGIIATGKTMYGIVLYNVKDSPEPFNGEKSTTGIIIRFDNVATFMSLEQVGIDNIKYIKNFNEHNFDELPTKYGQSSNPSCLLQALFLCTKMFKRSEYKLYDLRIFLMTANPEPVTRGSPEEKAMLNTAQDLQENGIQLIILPYTETFDIEPFYREFMAICDDVEPPEVEMNSPAEIKRLALESSKYPKYTKRPIAGVRLTLLGDVSISVQVFPTMRTCRPPAKGIVSTDTNTRIEAKRVTVLEKETVPVAEPSSEPNGAALNPGPRPNTNAGLSNADVRRIIEARKLLPSEITKYINLGDERVEFTNAEFQKLKKITEPGINILGFKPKQSLSLSLHMRGPLFIYPYEQWIKGSTELFSALWRKCLDLDQVALAIVTTTRGSLPKLAALIPQERDTDNFGDMQAPKREYVRKDGFLVSFIPFSDMIRELEIFNSAPEEPSPEEVQVMKKLMKRLKSNEFMISTENPKVTMLYRAIEAEVFDLEPPELRDTTAPNAEEQDERLEQVINRLSELFGEDVAVVEKRKAPKPAAGGTQAKLPRSGDSLDVINAYKQGKLDKLSVAQLKEFLTDRNVKGLSKLKKDGLIELVTNEIQDNSLA